MNRNCTSSKRIPCIDVAKGILILIMVIHHIPQRCPFTEGNVVFEYLDFIKGIYGSFFMAAFFFITGYCSNFNKKYTNFFFQDFKSLLFPVILFRLTLNITEYVLYNDPSYIGKLLRLDVWLNFYEFWFLGCLFLCKQVYYFINRLEEKYGRNLYYKYLFLLLLHFIGIYLVHINFGPNPFRWCQMLVYVLFVSLGHDCRPYNIVEHVKWGGYMLSSLLAIAVIFCVFGFEGPLFAGYIWFNPFSYPLFWIIFICGTGSIFFLSKKYEDNKFLSFFGKNSLLVYAFHYPILIVYFQLFENSKIGHDTIVKSMLCLILCMSVVIVLMTVIITLCNKKYVKWALAKW